MKDFLYISGKYKIRDCVKDDSQLFWSNCRFIYRLYIPFLSPNQVPSTSSRLAIMDLLFLRSMIKLWVHGGVPFYITLFFFLGIVCQHQKTASSTVLRSVL